MIDIKELRVGNVVYCKEIEKACIIFGIDYTLIDNGHISCIDKNTLYKYDSEKYNPIKITEKLLYDLGFKKEVDDIINREYYRLRLNGFCIDINKWSNTLGRDYGIHIDNLCCDSVLSGDIQYLHQLQNYIYNSTKQELDITNIL